VFFQYTHQPINQYEYTCINVYSGSASVNCPPSSSSAPATLKVNTQT
jgi:hypothetical protein